MKIVLSVAMVLFGTLAVEPSFARKPCSSELMSACEELCNDLNTNSYMINRNGVKSCFGNRCVCNSGKEFTVSSKLDESKAPAGNSAPVNPPAPAKR